MGVRERFWGKVDRRAGPGACWPWTAARDRDGYGLFWLDGRAQRASRVAFRLACGNLVHDALHRCDHRWCCNPSHLFDGTQAENVADMDAKGRRAPAKDPKLNLEKARRIRAFAAAGVLQRDIAEHFGVCPSVVSRVVRGEAYPEVE